MRGKTSLQFKFSMSYILIILAVLVLLNTYPLLVSQSLVFRTKETAMKSSVKMVESALSGLPELTEENVGQALASVEETGVSRLLVTDTSGRILFDTREGGSAKGMYAMYTEIVQALDGSDAFYCRYDSHAFLSRGASPVVYRNRIIGAVYAYEYDTQQAELPEGDELDALSTKLEIIGESAEAYLFFTDNDGRVMIASSPDKLESLIVPEEMMEKIDASDADYYHVFGTLGGMLDGKSYITVSEMRNEHGQPSGYLFLCSSGEQLTQFKQQFWSNFLLSACVMLLCASILTKILMRQLTDPLQKVTDAAQRFGGGDLSVRVEGVEGEGEAADLARTFNRMADNIQMNDNSRGQFMGNIAHELRTPMTTIKGFVDGILDGTIPPDMQNHYLQLVSEETGRLARLIQNMLDLSKLESGEYQVNARMFNIWETITGVALSAEQRINDGMIDIDGLTMDEKVLVYADPDLIHQVVYNLLDNAIKFTPAGGTIRFGVEKLGPEAEISIWNSGQGISPEALPYVFQRFYKEDRSRGLHARGAGLGLNICKVLVNLSGGQIRVESQQGEWCRFVFTLPTVAPNPGGMKRLPDEAGGEPTVEDPASMKPVE